MVDLGRRRHFDASERRASCSAVEDALSIPPLAVVALVSFNVFTPSFTLGVVFALVLLVADVVLFRIVSALFDRERRITGARAQRPSSGGGHVSPPGAVRQIPRVGEADDG
jgi:hypothetical protein